MAETRIISFVWNGDNYTTHYENEISLNATTREYHCIPQGISLTLSDYRQDKTKIALVVDFRFALLCGCLFLSYKRENEETNLVKIADYNSNIPCNFQHSIEETEVIDSVSQGTVEHNFKSLPIDINKTSPTYWIGNKQIIFQHEKGKIYVLDYETGEKLKHDGSDNDSDIYFNRTSQAWRWLLRKQREAYKGFI